MHKPLIFLVPKMGFTNLVAQPVSILRAKFWKVVMKCKKYFFNAFVLFLKMYLSEVATFFLALYLSSHLSFISGSSNL